MSSQQAAVSRNKGDAINGYRNLKVWQKSHKLTQEIFNVSNKFPKRYSFLISQMQRSALSIPANIVEGSARQGKNDRKRFYNISFSSLKELDYYLFLCYDLKMISKNQYDYLNKLIQEVARMLSGLIKSTK